MEGYARVHLALMRTSTRRCRLQSVDHLSMFKK